LAQEKENLLTDDFLRQLINVGEVDILVGLPTYNNAKTIGLVVQSVQSGILRWFPRERAVIINADGGSRDGTPELVTGVSIDDVRPAASLHALRTLHSVSTKYASTPESGTALHSIFAAAELLRAKACVVLSPDSENIQPEWLSRLVQPVYKDGYDLVAPTYLRHRFDGLLVTNLLYPMTRALYGLRIREPYPSEFGFSGNLGSQFLAQNHWEDGANQPGGELRPGIVHRLDRATSGLMVVAKNDEAHRQLATQFSERAVHKTYIALVHGWPKHGRGVIQSAISRHAPQPRHGRASRVLPCSARGRRASAAPCQ